MVNECLCDMKCYYSVNPLGCLMYDDGMPTPNEVFLESSYPIDDGHSDTC